MVRRLPTRAEATRAVNIIIVVVGVDRDSFVGFGTLSRNVRTISNQTTEAKGQGDKDKHDSIF